MKPIARKTLKLNPLNAETLRTCARPYARARVFLSAILLGLLLSAFAAVSPLQADSNPSNDSASLEIFITPNFDRGVEIDTANVHLNLGSLEMGVATQTVRPATVTIVGNVLNNELELSANIVGGWNFDDNVASQETDNLQAWAVFKSAADPVMPSKAASNFDDTDDAVTPATASPTFGPARVGMQYGNGGTDDRFEDGTTDMDSLAPQIKRHLWFYFRTPSVTSVTAQQEIHFTLTVTPGP